MNPSQIFRELESIVKSECQIQKVNKKNKLHKKYSIGSKITFRLFIPYEMVNMSTKIFLTN